MATLIEIKDYDVTKKEKVHLPENVDKIVKCINPKCVTNNQKVPTAFKVTQDHKGNMKLFCQYCEKTMAKENIIFI
jgi:aspartate carbamoyltransferase regulatory subunit